jgi:5-methyltetrahydropteroyltriglutamate--homocysteine methyltransferase
MKRTTDRMLTTHAARLPSPPDVMETVRTIQRGEPHDREAFDRRVRAMTADVVRHEHQWKVWQDVALPDGKILIPGVVAHATNLVEHPVLVADRLVRYADLLGRENVIAGTDYGLDGRLHPEIVWAKFQAMAEGARLASKQLWGR